MVTVTVTVKNFRLKIWLPNYASEVARRLYTIKFFIVTVTVTITRIPPTFAKFANIQKIFLKYIYKKKIIGSTKHKSKYMYQGVVFNFFVT